MSAADHFNLACAQAFACHVLRLDLDDVLEEAAAYQLATP